MPANGSDRSLPSVLLCAEEEVVLAWGTGGLALGQELGRTALFGLDLMGLVELDKEGCTYRYRDYP